MQIKLSQELQSVFNFGLGMEHGFDNGVAVYGAGFTDFSASTDATDDVSVANWNLYHLSGGVKFRFAGSRFTLGATYSFGSKDRPFPTPIPPEDLPGGASTPRWTSATGGSSYFSASSSATPDSAAGAPQRGGPP